MTFYTSVWFRSLCRSDRKLILATLHLVRTEDCVNGDWGLLAPLLEALDREHHDLIMDDEPTLPNA
jgi:hypothetical protein